MRLQVCSKICYVLASALFASALFVRSFNTFSKHLPHTSAKAALADIFSVFITCNIKIYMVTNIYMTCVRNSDALLTSYLARWERDSNRRTSASESETLPTELLGLDHLTTTYTVLISCTCEEKSVVLWFTSFIPSYV